MAQRRASLRVYESAAATPTVFGAQNFHYQRQKCQNNSSDLSAFVIAGRPSTRFDYHIISQFARSKHSVSEDESSVDPGAAAQ